MSGTTRYRPRTEPAGASVNPTPNWIEACDPSGVNWMTRNPGAGA